MAEKKPRTSNGRREPDDRRILDVRKAGGIDPVSDDLGFKDKERRSKKERRSGKDRRKGD